MTKTPTLTALEAAGILYAVGMGFVKPKLIGDQNWRDTYAGDVEYEVAGWKITIFNDCDSWDYISRVEAPDGRWGEYAEWMPLSGVYGIEYDLPHEPDAIVGLMNQACHDNMQRVFIAATAKGAFTE